MDACPADHRHQCLKEGKDARNAAHFFLCISGSCSPFASETEKASIASPAPNNVLLRKNKRFHFIFDRPRLFALFPDHINRADTKDTGFGECGGRKGERFRRFGDMSEQPVQRICLFGVVFQKHCRAASRHTFIPPAIGAGIPGCPRDRFPVTVHLKKHRRIFP